jgi:hypothetical protein
MHNLIYFLIIKIFKKAKKLEKFKIQKLLDLLTETEGVYFSKLVTHPIE